MNKYYPFVYWAQDVNNIFLRVEIKSLVNYQLTVANGGRLLIFQGMGIPLVAEGDMADLSQFEFQLFLASAVVESFECKEIEKGLNIILKKQNAGFWKNGLVNPDHKLETKLWLKFDFDKWKDDPEDVDNEDVDFEQGDGLRMRKSTVIEDLLQQIEKDKKEVTISSSWDFYKKIFYFLVRLSLSGLLLLIALFAVIYFFYYMYVFITT
uniref:CS domain-containing protein n=1 Tax=Meloidogyne incognita TaxID=6306 RepID=A0A914N660_MELIC